MITLPARIFLFDTDEHEKNIREGNLHDAHKRLIDAAVAEGGGPIVVPEIRATRSRRQLFEWLDREPEPCVIVVDLHSDPEEHVGWIGARILRSVAEDPDLERRCWRIALSKYATAEIASELEGHAHAIVQDTATGVDQHLATAIRTAIAHPPSKRVAITQHPATQAPRDWAQALRTAVYSLVGHASLRGDEFIVQSLIRDVPGDVINEELRRERAAEAALSDAVEPRRRTVNDFLQAVKAQLGEPTVDAAHGRVREVRDGLRARTIYRSLSPDVVERARIVLSELAFERQPASRHRLPEDCRDMAAEFVSGFSRLVTGRGHARAARARALRELLQEPAFSSEVETLQYAIWSLSDVTRAEPLGAFGIDSEQAPSA